MTQLKSKARILRFGSFELDIKEGRLAKGGLRVRLQEQPLQVLVLLLERPGEVVTREEFRQKLWSQDTFVEFDDGLNTAVGKLRASLGDSADNPRFLETVPRRGYRFIAPITVAGYFEDPEPAKPPEDESLVERDRTQSPGKKLPRPRALVALALAGIFLASAAGYWFYHSRTTYALGASDTILLADFANNTGEVAFDDTLRQALSISLQQSPFLNILSDRKVNETLRLMNRDSRDAVTGETALEVCQRAGARAVLTGSIANLGTQFVIGLQAINCQNGDVFAREQVQATRKEDVLKVLGYASANLRRSLGESLSSVRKFDMPLEQATTSSLEALRSYSAAVRIRNEHGAADAIPFLRRAIELDPNFALAYGMVSVQYQLLGEDGLGKEYAEKAYSLRSRVTERENFALTNFYYQFVEGDREDGLRNCELWAQTYPRDVVAHTCLFFVRELLGRYHEALPEGLQCVAVEPSAGFCYADLILNYAALNRMEDAKAIYQKAIEHGVYSSNVHSSRYELAFLQGDTAEMERQVTWASTEPENEEELLFAESRSEGFYGRLVKGRELVTRAAESSSRHDQKERAARWRIHLALEESLVGDVDQARQEARAALQLGSFEFVQSMAALTEAWNGDSPAAEKMTHDLAGQYGHDTLLQFFWIPTIQAAIEIRRHRAGKAIELLRPAEPFELGEHVPMIPAFVRAQAYLELGQGSEAASEFRKIIDNRNLVGNSVIVPLSTLGLARAWLLQAKSLQGTDGDAALIKARAAYAEYFNLWKDADPDIPILKEARAEYAKLN